VAFEPELHGEEEVDPERILGGKEELQVATKVLLQLPERTRTVFVLRRIEGWKFQQIAAHLGISVSAVEKHMVRAVEQLGIEMEKRRGS
jgi:RNA polymerase sigma-70 factor (ECF subfamily)